MVGGLWRTRLTARAESDLLEIIAWTTEAFGPAQARKYRGVIYAAVRLLAKGPAVIGARSQDHIQSGLLSLHVAREGRRGRHFLLFRVTSREERKIEIIRILHDHMDLVHHIPPTE
jgi:toxin ParE1/3/4